MSKPYCIFVLSIIFYLPWSNASSWSNWLGPNYTGSIDGADIEPPAAGTEYLQLWVNKIGTGWSSPIVTQGKVILHDRLGGFERVQCLDALTGDKLWEHSFESDYRDNFGMSSGPRSTPGVKNGIIVTHSPNGLVHGISLAGGDVLWKRDLRAEYQSPKGFFGRCSSPLLIGKKAILEVGGEQAGIVAFSLQNGETLWESIPRAADYASCVPFKYKNADLILNFMRDGLIAVDALTGKERFFSSFRSQINASVHAATPLVIGDTVFLSACYELGASVWRLTGENDKSFSSMFTKRWAKKGVLDSHYSTPVYYQGYLFGVHGRQEHRPQLRCIELSSGTVQWSKEGLGAGNLLRVGNKIIFLSETGELILFQAQSKSFDILHRQQVLGRGRAHFAFSEGMLFLRDERRLVSIQISPTNFPNL